MRAVDGAIGFQAFHVCSWVVHWHARRPSMCAATQSIGMRAHVRGRTGQGGACACRLSEERPTKLDQGQGRAGPDRGAFIFVLALCRGMTTWCTTLCRHMHYCPGLPKRVKGLLA